jgi:hypothetical protein
MGLFRQFSGVEALRVSAPLTGRVADVLKDVTTEMAPERLPALCLIDEELVGRVEKSITRTGSLVSP